MNLWRETAYFPAAFFNLCIKNPIVQSTLAALPEFDALRPHQVSAPVRWARRRPGDEALLHFSHEVFQFRAVCNASALRRSPGPELAAARPRREVGIGFLRRDLFDVSLDAHLTIEDRPIKRQRRPGARL